MFANHTDFKVAPIDQLFVLWTDVNRVSRDGHVIGPDQRISPLEALNALTINAACWYHEENMNGSLEAGKLADLVILDKNPLTVARLRSGTSMCCRRSNNARTYSGPGNSPETGLRLTRY